MVELLTVDVPDRDTYADRCRTADQPLRGRMRDKDLLNIRRGEPEFHQVVLVHRGESLVAHRECDDS